MIKASENVLGFIRGEEDFRAEEYDDGYGNKTIGYGMTTGNMGRKLTPEEADHDMRERVKLAEDELSRNVTRPGLPQNKADVLVDMHFNLGLSNMKGFIDLVNTGSDEQVEAEILRYTKAMNKKTGQMEDVPALQKRVQKRLSMWRNAPELVGDEADIMAAIQIAKGSAPDNDVLAAIQVAKSEGMAQTRDPERLRNGLTLASDVANPEEALRNQEARRLVTQLGIPLEEAQARLVDKDFKTVVAENAHNTIAEFFPAVAEWVGRDPDNYVMLKETEDWARKIELAGRSLNKQQRSDWSKALNQNTVEVEQALVWPQIVYGKLSLEEGKKLLGEIDDRRSGNQLTNPGAQAIAKSIDDMDKGGDIWDVIKTMAMNPQGTALMTLQSGGTSFAPLAAGIAVGALNPVAGVGAAFGTGHLLAFSSYMQKQLEEFRDPQTGEINYDIAFSDAVRLKQWQREADIYGGVMGVSDAFYSAVGGKFLLKHAAGGGLKGAAKGIAKGTAVKAAEEGLSETTALTATDLYAGRLTEKKLKSNINEGQVEAVFGALMGGPIEVIGAGIRTVVNKPKHSAVKTVKTVAEANQANEDMVALSQLRALKDEQDLSRQNPEQTQDLIDTVLNQTNETEVVDSSPFTEDVGPLEASESRNMDREADTDSVYISPSEWDEYHKFQGIDPLEALKSFAPSILQDYARSKNSDTSFSIPTSEWLRFTEEDPAIDAIARINGNALNGLEANATLESFEKDPQTLFDKDEIPSLPEEDASPEPSQDQPIEIIEADPNGPSNLAMRPVELQSKFRNDDDKTVFTSILSRLKRASKDNESMEPKMLEVFTELQFRHMKNRAEMLGIPLAELAKKLKIGKTKKGENDYVHGVFRHTNRMDDPYTVAFAPSADTKTLVHEFGHSWLHELALDYDVLAGINETTMTDAQREYWLAMQTMAEFAGLENIGKLLTTDKENQTRIHETFAQTTELYFLEGKLENNGMRAMMETFRQWVVQVIDRIKGMTYKQYPPLKITPKVERMFEAILGVSGKVEDEVIPMFPEPLFDPAMLGAQGAKYLSTIKDARSEAIGKAYLKSWNKTIKEQEALIDAEYNRIYDAAVEEVDSRRAMIILAGFKDAYNDYRTDSEGDTPDPRLSFESVLKVMAKGDLAVANKIKDSVPREMMAGKKKGGMPVEQFMFLNGITDPNEMLDLLMETGRRDVLIEESVNARIARDFPTMKSEEEIHRITVEAVNSRGKERLLLEEIGIMMDKYKGDFKTLISKLINPPSYVGAPTKENINAEGTRLVRDAKVYKFSAMNFLRDSHRHGRDAARKFKKNNMVEAIDSKLKEAVHFFGYLQAVSAQKKVANVRLREKQFVKYSKSKDAARTYDVDIMGYGRAVINAVRTGQDIPAFDPQGLPDYSGVTAPLIADINAAIELFQNQVSGRSGIEISIGNFISYGEILKKILFTARKAKEAEVDGIKLARETVIDGISKDIAPRFDEEGNVVDSVNFTERTIGGEINRSFVGTRALLASLYPSKEAFTQSFLGQLFFGVVNAEAERNAFYSDVRNRIAKAVRDGIQKDTGLNALLNPIANRASKIAPFIPSRDKTGKPINAPKLGENGFTFANKGELYMACLMALGSESGAKKFLMGYNLASFDFIAGKLDTSNWDETIADFIADGTLTKKDFDMFQTIWDVMEEVHPRVADAMRKSDGWSMGQVKGKAFSNEFGEYRGGYMPIGPKDLMTNAMTSTLLDPDTNGYSISDLYPAMNTGLTNERSEKFYPVNLDMTRLNSYLSAAVNIAYLRNPLLEFGRVIEHPLISGAIEARRPGAIGDKKGGVITKWFDAVKSQTYTEYSTEFPQMVSKYLRQNLNMTMYLLNFMTPIKQYLGLLPAAGAVGPVRLIRASANFAASPKSTIARIKSESVVMLNRLDNSQEMMVRSWDQLDTNFDWISWTDDKKNLLTWWLIQKNQNVVDVITYEAAKERGLAKGMTTQQAINFAADIVNTTQSSPDVSSMVNLQRGKDSWKLMTSVTSVPIAINNWTREETMRDATLSAKARALFVIALSGYIAAPMLEAWIGEMGAEEDDELTEEERSQQALLTMGKRTAMGSIDTLLPWWGRWGTSWWGYGHPSAAPFLSKVQRAPTVGKAVKHLGQGVDLSTREVVTLLETVSIVSGVPLNILGKGILAEEMLQDQETLDERENERKDQLASIRDEE